MNVDRQTQSLVLRVVYERLGFRRRRWAATSRCDVIDIAQSGNAKKWCVGGIFSSIRWCCSVVENHGDKVEREQEQEIVVGVKSVVCCDG